MTMTVLSILSIALAVSAVITCYIPRVPSVLLAWVGLFAAHFTGAPYISGSILFFWGVATGIIILLNQLQPRALTLMRAGVAYVVTGTIAGTALGYVCSPVVAAIIIGAAAGAFLGAVAFTSLPKGPKLGIASPEFIQYLCAKGLPAVISCSQAAIVLASVL